MLFFQIYYIFVTSEYSIFSSWDLDKRKRYVRLVDAVKDNGGDVKIFSSLHVSGERK